MKKGFTLVELIGVITLLGVIALIAFPTVTKTINNSREQAYLEQVRKIERAALQYGIETNGVFPDEDSNEIKTISLNELINSGYVQMPEDKVIINPITKEEMTGCVLTQYNPLRNQHVVHYSEDCNSSSTISPIISEVTINYGDNVATSTYFQTTDASAVICPVSSTKDLSVAKHTITCQTEADSGLVFNSSVNIIVNPKVSAVVYYNPVTGTTCNDYVEQNSANGFKDGCMKWYVYKIDGNNISLLLDHNTTTHVAWCSATDYNAEAGTSYAYDEMYVPNDLGPLTLMKQLERDTINWIIEADIMDAYYIPEITGYKEVNGTDWELINYYFDNNLETMSPTCSWNWIGNATETVDISGCKYGWLYDRTRNDCKNFGCLNSQINGDDIGAYWLKTAVLNSQAFHIYGPKFAQNYVNISVTAGVRPVITVTLSNLTS